MGIQLYNGSNNDTISCNKARAKISNNHIGIFLSGSKNNLIYHNNFLHTRYRGSAFARVGDKLSNVWDNGLTSGGNYWEDHSSVDNDGDGKGNIPVVIGENNKDRYPLMSPFDVSNVTIELPEWTYPSPSPTSQDNPSPTELFPTELVAASVAAAAVISVGLLVYLKKRKH